MKYKTREQFEAEIQVTSDMEILNRILPCLMNKQTPDELADGETYHKNNIGVNTGDAPLFSSLLERKEVKFSIKTIEVMDMRRRLPKYWRQL